MRHKANGNKKNHAGSEEFSLKSLISSKYKILSEQEIDKLIAREAERSVLHNNESSILNQITDVKGPDGMKVLHHGSGVKVDPSDVKRRFTIEAKKNLKEFVRL